MAVKFESGKVATFRRAFNQATLATFLADIESGRDLGLPARVVRVGEVRIVDVTPFKCEELGR